LSDHHISKPRGWPQGIRKKLPRCEASGLARPAVNIFRYQFVELHLIYRLHRGYLLNYINTISILVTNMYIQYISFPSMSSDIQRVFLFFDFRFVSHAFSSSFLKSVRSPEASAKAASQQDLCHSRRKSEDEFTSLSVFRYVFHITHVKKMVNIPTASTKQKKFWNMGPGKSTWQRRITKIIYPWSYTIWLFNIAMENHHAINR
jgi:hypothetical protein